MKLLLLLCCSLKGGIKPNLKPRKGQAKENVAPVHQLKVHADLPHDMSNTSCAVQILVPKHHSAKAQSGFFYASYFSLHCAMQYLLPQPHSQLFSNSVIQGKSINGCWRGKSLQSLQINALFQHVQMGNDFQEEECEQYKQM